ncbi:MAG: toprim domain-containing protein [Prolixibacteraceae bacterium]|nr:toprim domain-containing protein [Prolixibacteraceae bacterium]
MTFEELRISTKPGKVRYSTICPECNDTRQKHKNVPCLTVNDEPDNQWWNCSHCGWKGNLGSMEKFAKVAEKSRMPKQVAETYSKEVREYLEKRGIDMKVAQKELIYEYSMGGKPIMGFPFYINLTLVNVKYFNVRWKPGDDSPKWFQMKRELGTKSIFLGMQNLSFDEGEKKEVIITEGEWDWLTWKQCGYKNVVSVPMGAPNPNAKEFEHEFDYANDKYVQSFFAGVESIIFSTDNDKPGHVLRNQLALIFGKERCKYIQYPVGYKDVNDVFKGNNKSDVILPALGKAGVDECYQNLSSFPVKGIVRPQDVRDELEMIAADGFTPGLGIGIPAIDELFTLKRKQFTVVTGLPSSGKSVWVRWYLSEFVRHNDKEDVKWALFTPENRPVSREQAKVAEVITGQSFKRGYRNSMTEELRAKTLRYIQKKFFFIAPNKLNFETWLGKVDSDHVNSMESLLQYLVYLKKTENIFGFVIDAWNKIEHEQPRNQTETTFISKQLDYLINFCDVYDVHCILIAHPTKIEKVGINYRMPCLYDIKGSSAWKEKPDVGIIIHRYMNKKKKPEDIPDDATDDDKIMIDTEAPNIIVTEKIRFEETGKLGKIKMRMDFAKGGRFYVTEDKKKPPEPIKGALNPPKAQQDEVFDNGKDELNDLPF